MAEPLLATAAAAAAAHCLMCSRAALTFRRVQSPGPATVFGVVVHKHVVGDCEDVAVHVDRGRHHHLGMTKQKNITKTEQNNICVEASDLNDNTTCKVFILSNFLRSIPALHSGTFQS